MKNVIVITMLAHLVFMSSLSYPEMKPKEGGNLIFAHSVGVLRPDPASAYSVECYRVIKHVFDGLVRYYEDHNQIEPALAVSWDVSPDKKNWIFHLRKDVLFHDGSAFDAHAVHFSFKRIIDKKHPFYPEEAGYGGYFLRHVETIEVIDDYTVKFVLKEGVAPFLSILASPTLGIVSPVSIKKLKGEFTNHPVGTGPFVFKEWIKEDKVVLERNDRYWGGKPYLKTVVFRQVKNRHERLTGMRAGSIHITDVLDPNIINKMKQYDNIQLKHIMGANLLMLTINNEKKPFDNIDVRKAVAYALNKERIVKFLYQEIANPAVSIIPPTIWGHHKGLVDYEYNPEKAKTLLKKAGYPNGFKTTLWQMPVERPYNPKPKQISTLIQSNLSAVGIIVDIIKIKNFDDYWKKSAFGEHELMLDGWVGAYFDPDHFIYLLLDKDNATKGSAMNLAFYKDDNVHELLIKAQQTMDREERTRYYYEAQEIIHRQVPNIPIAHFKQYIAFQKKVHGIVLDPSGYHSFSKAWIDE